jgi:hypothetical protein
METVGFTSNLVIVFEKAELWGLLQFYLFLLLIVENLFD